MSRPLAEPAPAPEAMAAVRAPFLAFGGEWIDPPVLQPLSRLLDLAGEAMRARLFVAQGEGAGELCLRPDFTIAIAATHIASERSARRYLYEGKAFRTSREPARPLEFLQIGAEIYGPCDDPVAQEVEVAAVAWRAAQAGGRRDLGLVLGDVGLFADFLAAIGLSRALASRLAHAHGQGRDLNAELARVGAAAPPGGSPQAQRRSGRPEDEAAGVLEEVWRLAGVSPVGGRSAAEIAHRLCARADAAAAPRLSPAEAGLVARYLEIVAPPREALERIEALAREAGAGFDTALPPWARRLKLLVDSDVPETAMILAPGFVRPFGYYDGVLFEVRSLDLGFDRPVAAGGRYDGLPARLGAAAAEGSGAVGCMVRPGRAVAVA